MSRTFFRYFLECSYIGTNYGGWQRQNNSISVQEIIEKALSTILRKNILIYGSSRTDAGVHARKQFAHFDVNEKLTFDLDLLKHKANCIMSKDIAINSIYFVDSEKHARFSATSRKYIYRISQNKDPFDDITSYSFPVHLDIKLMNEACSLLTNRTLDCEIFCKSNSAVSNFKCHILYANWEQNGPKINFCIEANRFLHGMVRIITGYMLQIGQRKLSIDIFRNLIDYRISTSTPRLAPAKGLTLEEVKY